MLFHRNCELLLFNFIKSCIRNSDWMWTLHEAIIITYFGPNNSKYTNSHDKFHSSKNKKFLFSYIFCASSTWCSNIYIDMNTSMCEHVFPFRMAFICRQVAIASARWFSIIMFEHCISILMWFINFLDICINVVRPMWEMKNKKISLSTIQILSLTIEFSAKQNFICGNFYSFNFTVCVSMWRAIWLLDFVGSLRFRQQRNVDLIWDEPICF